MILIGLDGQSVIIFGGQNIPSSDALYVLNLSNFEWSVPKISGKVPNSRFDHKANVFGNYILISFGKYILKVHFIILYKLVIILTIKYYCIRRFRFNLKFMPGLPYLSFRIFFKKMTQFLELYIEPNKYCNGFTELNHEFF